MSDDSSDPGVGLAYTAFFTFYRTIALSLLERIKEYESENGIHVAVKKVFILMPTSCWITPELGDCRESDIEVANAMREVRVPRAGTRHRNFKNTVYSIKDGDNDPIFCVAEGATPLLTLYDMKKRELLTKDEMVEQLYKFYGTLQELFNADDNCVGRFSLIVYEDNAGEKVTKVSEILREAVYREMNDLGCSNKEDSSYARPRTVANVGNDLAVAYYSGYLKLMENPREISPLQGKSSLLDRIEEYEIDNKINLVAKKLFILMPASCSIDPELGEDDVDMDFANAMKDLRVSRAGIKHRRYANTVYVISNGEDDPFFCVAEGATPLLTLFEMKEFNILTEEQMVEQMNIFKRKLEELLSLDTACGNLFRLVAYDDRNPARVRKISDILREAILKELGLTQDNHLLNSQTG